jgi:DNA-binding transcriptional LysR family regulator
MAPSLPSLPSLHALLCFDAAARAGSFTAAGRVMGLTHGAVSRQVRQLEAEIGVALFVRSGRDVALTTKGRALLVATGHAFSTLQAGIADLVGGEDAPLVVSCEPTLTLHWLIPRLHQWQANESAPRVHVESSGGPIDLVRRGVDLAIRRADFEIPAHLHRETLFSEWVGPVCAPGLADALRKGRRVTLLETRTRLDAFSEWSALTGRSLIHDRPLMFDHFAMSIQAAIARLGVAMGPHPLVMDALAAGRLVAPLGFVRTKATYVLLSTRAPGEEPRTDALRAWLHAQARRARPGSGLTAARW